MAGQVTGTPRNTKRERGAPTCHAAVSARTAGHGLPARPCSRSCTAACSGFVGSDGCCSWSSCGGSVGAASWNSSRSMPSCCSAACRCCSAACRCCSAACCCTCSTAPIADERADSSPGAWADGAGTTGVGGAGAGARLSSCCSSCSCGGAAAGGAAQAAASAGALGSGTENADRRACAVAAESGAAATAQLAAWSPSVAQGCAGTGHGGHAACACVVGRAEACGPTGVAAGGGLSAAGGSDRGCAIGLSRWRLGAGSACRPWPCCCPCRRAPARASASPAAAASSSSALWACSGASCNCAVPALALPSLLRWLPLLRPLLVGLLGDAAHGCLDAGARSADTGATGSGLPRPMAASCRTAAAGAVGAGAAVPPPCWEGWAENSLLFEMPALLSLAAAAAAALTLPLAAAGGTPAAAALFDPAFAAATFLRRRCAWRASWARQLRRPGSNSSFGWNRAHCKMAWRAGPGGEEQQMRKLCCRLVCELAGRGTAGLRCALCHASPAGRTGLARRLAGRSLPSCAAGRCGNAGGKGADPPGCSRRPEPEGRASSGQIVRL